MSKQGKPTPPAQPKGSMCAACHHAARDCSGLEFDKMPTLERAPDGARVVKCQDFTRKAAPGYVVCDTATMEGPPLDWAVGVALGKALRIFPSEYGTGPRVFIEVGTIGQLERWRPSTDPAQGGLLIREKLVELLAPDEDSPYWAARIRVNDVIRFGPCPFVAACRVLLAVTFGDAVEVPAALLEPVQ